MPETLVSRARPIALAAALGAVLALAAAYPAAAQSPPELVVEPAAGGTLVRYLEGGVEALSAVVAVSADGTEIRGRVAGLPYSWSSREEADGSLQVLASVGAESFAGTLVPGQEEAPDARAFREFRDRADGGPAGAVVRRLAATVHERRTEPLGCQAAALAAANGAATVSVPLDSPFREYATCLKDSCGDCGGCWRDDVLIADCYACPGTSFWQRLGAGMCYAVQMQICFNKHIIRFVPR